MKKVLGFVLALTFAIGFSADATVLQDFEGSGQLGVDAGWGTASYFTAGRASGALVVGAYGRCDRSAALQGESIYGVGTAIGLGGNYLLSGWMRCQPDKPWAGDPANWCWYELDYAWGNHDSAWCRDNGGSLIVIQKYDETMVLPPTWTWHSTILYSVGYTAVTICLKCGHTGNNHSHVHADELDVTYLNAVMDWTLY